MKIIEKVREPTLEELKFINRITNETWIYGTLWILVVLFNQGGFVSGLFIGILLCLLIGCVRKQYKILQNMRKLYK